LEIFDIFKGYPILRTAFSPPQSQFPST